MTTDESPSTKVCKSCWEEKPLSEFNVTKRKKGKEYRHSKCRACMKECYQEYSVSLRPKQQTPRPRRKLATVYDCKLCELYPCFQGMEHISSNLAETCVKYTIKQTT